MRRSLIAAAALSALVVAPAVVLAQDASTPALAPTTVRVLVHQNPPFTAYMEQFNAKFQAGPSGGHRGDVGGRTERSRDDHPDPSRRERRGCRRHLRVQQRASSRT